MSGAAVTAGRSEAWRKRLEGLVPAAVETRRVLVVGCGSVGSFMADELARSGVRRFVLIDPDTVEWANLTRTVYGHSDVGRLKVDALSDHLRAVFPDIEIETRAERLQTLGLGLRDLLADVDLVIGAVDDPQASGRISRFAYATGVCALFVGLYRGAQGGEVVLSLPGITPCLACATGGRHRIEHDSGGSVSRARDYGTSRLVAEVALGSDIHMVCTAGVKLALSLLCIDDPASPLGRFAGDALAQGRHYLIMGMTPDYFLFPRTHAEALGQYAFQSVWMGSESRTECTVCGDPGQREPLA